MAIRRYGLDQLRALSRLPAALQEPLGIPEDIRTAPLPPPPPPPPLPVASPPPPTTTSPPPTTTTPPPPPPPPGCCVRAPPPTAVHPHHLRPVSPVPMTQPRKPLNAGAVPFRPSPVGLRPEARPYNPLFTKPSSPPTVLPPAAPSPEGVLGRVLSSEELYAMGAYTPRGASPYSSGKVSPLKDMIADMIPPPPPLLPFPDVDVPEVELGVGLRDRS